MPGMMDTVLNLGLNAATAEGLAKLTGDERFAYDSYRRFIQMYSDVVLGVDHALFEEILDEEKDSKGVELDTDLDAADLKRIAGLYKARVEKELGKPFPEDVQEQLWGAIGAVFGSWRSPRANTYRKLNNIPEDWGTAVTVQAMVFGNRGETSATGVAFTRDPATGEKLLYGEFLINAQGEDVVAGIRTPQPISKMVRERQGGKRASMEEAMPKAYAELMAIGERLERHYRDMQDVEFTIQEGKLFMLQTRSGKRTAEAALRCAVDMEREGLIDRKVAITRVEPEALNQLLHPTLDPDAPREQIAIGLGASPAKAFWRVTVPLMLPGIVAGAMMSFITSINELSSTLLLYTARTTTMPVKIYSAVLDGEFGIAAALSTLLLASSGLCVYVVLRFSQSKENAFV